MESIMSWKRKILVLFLAGCLSLEQPLRVLAQPALLAPANNEVVPGLVIIVEEIGGLDVIGISAAFSIRQAGLPHEVHHFTWTHGTGKFLKDLQDTLHILKKADELAAFIKDYRVKHPNRPIYIVGKSGGTGLVLFALQTLPPNSIERVILLSAAVSPNYDLRAALQATRREVISFHSRNDRYILGWGTSKFGTIDRYYGQSAGLTGFVIPESLSEQDRQLYMRLIQVPFSSRMLREGVSTGTHHSTSMPWFVTSEVLPWLR
jgi:pimeloyl-ACP methyl ester carboxylesterase